MSEKSFEEVEESLKELNAKIWKDQPEVLAFMNNIDWRKIENDYAKELDKKRNKKIAKLKNQ